MPRRHTLRLDGFSLDDAVPLYGDAPAKVVSWKAGPDCGRVAGSPVRLRIRLSDADLYAIQFVEARVHH